jgi:uncharacterized protein YbjT (DUF2867 family)
MILVTGATGTVGGHVTRLLSERGVPFRAMSRNPVDLPNAVRADFTDPPSLAAAVAGAEAVFLVTVPPTPTPDHDLALVAAARSAGVRKIVKLSAIGTGERFDGRTVGWWHAAAEEAIEASGLAWTVLRPPGFASNVLWYRDLINAEKPLPDIYGAARQPIIDPRDVAAVAVEALLTSEHEGQRYDLTGPELLTFAQQAAILEAVLHRPVRTAPQPASDLPADVATGLGWARAGGAEYLTEHVSRILGHPPTTFEQWANDHRAAFGASG